MPGMNLAYDNENNYDLDKYRHLNGDNRSSENNEKDHEYITIKRKNADRGNTIKIVLSALAALATAIPPPIQERPVTRAAAR